MNSITDGVKNVKNLSCVCPELLFTTQLLLLPYAKLLCTPTLRHQHRWPHAFACKAKPGLLQMLTHRVLLLLKNDPNASPCSETFKQLSVITKHIKRAIQNNSRSFHANIFPWKHRTFSSFFLCCKIYCMNIYICSFILYGCNYPVVIYKHAEVMSTMAW